MYMAVGYKDTVGGVYNPPAITIRCQIYFTAVPVCYLIKFDKIGYYHQMKKKKRKGDALKGQSMKIVYKCVCEL